MVIKQKKPEEETGSWPVIAPRNVAHKFRASRIISLKAECVWSDHGDPGSLKRTMFVECEHWGQKQTHNKASPFEIVKNI